MEISCLFGKQNWERAQVCGIEDSAQNWPSFCFTQQISQSTGFITLLLKL